MSDPQLPDAPPPAQQEQAAPAAAASPLSAEPQPPHGPAAAAPAAPVGHPAAPQAYPVAPPAYPTAAPGYPTAGQAQPASAPGYPVAPGYPTPQGYPAAPQAYSTAAPAYPTAAQGYPASAQPGFPGYDPAPGDARPRNTLGRTAFLIAVITFGVNLLTTLTRPFLYFSDRGFETAGFIDGGVAALSVIAYGIALVLGIIAARRAAPHLFAGIAIGIAGVGVLGVLFGWVSTFFYRFL